MDGLSSSSDKTLFSEALTLYMYRYRLAQGPRDKLTNMIILEEAHNLLLKKSSESKESVLENSIRIGQTVRAWLCICRPIRVFAQQGCFLLTVMRRLH